jgi:hypothetical protein
MQPSPAGVCQNAGEIWESSLVVGRDGFTPYVPIAVTPPVIPPATPIAAAVAGETTATPAITFTGGPAAAGGTTLTVTATTDNIAAPTILASVPITAGMTADQLADAVVAAVAALANAEITATKGAAGVVDLGVDGVNSTTYATVAAVIA